MFTLRQPKSGLPVEDISRKVAICQAVFFRCKIKYAAISIEEILLLWGIYNNILEV